MAQIILYPNQEYPSQVVLLIPSRDCGLTIDQIAQKDVPTGVPYIYLDESQLPTGTDNVYIEAWTADFSNPVGFGADHGIGSMKSVVSWNLDGTPITRQEEVKQ